MQKAFTLLTAAMLMSSSGFAAEKSGTASDIFDDLMNYEPAPAAPVAPKAAVVPAKKAIPAPVVKKATPVKNVEKPVVVQKNAVPAPVAKKLPTAVVATLPDDSTFIAAQQGLADAVVAAPEKMATLLGEAALLERDQRTAEVEGLDATRAAWATELVFRSYTLGSDAAEKMELGTLEDSTDVMSSFPQVQFPKGSSAIYQPKMGVLFVRNTQQNFVVLEAILGAMDLAKLSADVDQVEIEAKFVEVSEGTLEELGFEWDFDDDVAFGIGGDDTIINDGGNGLFANALRGSPSGNSPNLPFSQNIGLGDGRASATGNWSSFGIIDTFNTTPDSLLLRNEGSNPFDLLLSALDQSTGADVLSAPRIVTRSGQEAVIRVGEMHSFPEVYEGDSAQATMLNVSYQDFEKKLLGVELEVTPEVDGEQITLTLNPRITELAGWRNYQLAPENSIYNHRQLGKWKTYTHEAVVAKLPIFKKREIKTEVTLQDGSTIGMGGLINESVEAFEDKVPFLGSLPLIGRLFRNEGERVVKRNLLMFATAKKVEPSGRINTTRSFE